MKEIDRRDFLTNFLIPGGILAAIMSLETGYANAQEDEQEEIRSDIALLNSLIVAVEDAGYSRDMVLLHRINDLRMAVGLEPVDPDGNPLLLIPKFNQPEEENA